jgi:hypothetical protein
VRFCVELDVSGIRRLVVNYKFSHLSIRYGYFTLRDDAIPCDSGMQSDLTTLLCLPTINNVSIVKNNKNRIRLMFLVISALV